jgi:hypothetical protein
VNVDIAAGNQASLERMYTVQEIADAWQMEVTTVRRAFLNYPGVLRFGHSTTAARRQRFTLRIPESVYRKYLDDHSARPLSMGSERVRIRRKIA